ICTTFQSIVGSVLGTGIAPTGSAVVGFAPITGAPIYAPVSDNIWQKYSGNISYTGGNVGIGTATPNAKLEVYGGKVSVGSFAQDYAPIAGNWNYTLQLNAEDTSSIGFHDAGSAVGSIRFKNNLFTIGADDGWGIADTALAGNLTTMGSITAIGNVTADIIKAQGFIYVSDRRLKQNITALTGSLNKILSLNGYSFDWIKNGKHDVGVIAQEVENVFPTLVNTNPETGMKGVAYGNLVAPIIEAIKEMVIKQNTQEREIQNLKDEILKLKKAKK
ncbi:tail fiber domain-containing protein, partial [Candidatus Gracilibacteria bacterium]|nr:tail fiber domain-containing protein [Candidatus Gracilibacteria bacterium]